LTTDAVISHIRIIFTYKDFIVYTDLSYSTLNPETKVSDSASKKSTEL